MGEAEFCAKAKVVKLAPAMIWRRLSDMAKGSEIGRMRVIETEN